MSKLLHAFSVLHTQLGEDVQQWQQQPFGWAANDSNYQKEFVYYRAAAAVLILALFPALKPAIVLLLQQQQPKSTHTFLQNALLDNCFALLLLHSLDSFFW